ncbi:MAG: hypothetical protein CL610_06875 [Anaerolineaceae bacterium]|nr:hypothetical protein [Anaerolineaceae bacterium]
MNRMGLLRRWSLSALLLLIGITPLSAQSPSPPFAAFDNGMLIYNNGAGDSISILAADYAGHVTWNVDGTQFGFVRYIERASQNAVSELGFVDLTTAPNEAVILQTQHLAWGYTASWMRDGRLLFAVENPEANPVTGLRDKVDVMAAQPGQQPALLGTFQAVGECGGGSSFPAAWRYAKEIGGLDSFRTLADMPYGILYSTDCAGSQLALMDPATGESTPFADFLTKAVVSPDGAFVAGIKRDYTISPLVPRLVVFEIATGQSRIIPTTAEPTLVAWSRDNRGLYYSIQTFDHNLLDDLPDEFLAQFNAAYGFELGYVPAYTVSVHHIDLDTEQTTLVYEGDAFVIARITEAASAVYISQIPNMGRWVDGIRQKEIAVDNLQANLAAVPTEVVAVERTEAGFGTHHFFGYFEQFMPFVR